MQSCSSALCVLILLISLTDAVPTVKVKLHDSATLPCSKRCSGLVRWTVFHKPTDVLAECNQTSCRSVKEGYQMIHDQYLKGDFSLTITDANFTKRARYTSDCDGKDLCDVELQVKDFPSVRAKRHGSPTLPCSETCTGVVRWIVSSKPRDTLAMCNQTLCRSVKDGYNMSYEQCQSGNHSLTITDADLSKSGVYTCECSKSEICDVHLQVEEPEKQTDNKGDKNGPSSDEKQEPMPGWATALIIVAVVLVLVVLYMLVKYRARFRRRLNKSVLDNDDKKPIDLGSSSLNYKLTSNSKV